MSGPTSGGAPNASECKLFLNWFVGPLGVLSDAKGAVWFKKCNANGNGNGFGSITGGNKFE